VGDDGEEVAGEVVIANGSWAAFAFPVRLCRKETGCPMGYSSR
jgi:hypothetical protein